MSKCNGNPRVNASGCSDPTAYDALKQEYKEIDRFQKLLKTLFYICECAGFSVENRIELRDMRTGRLWR